MHPSFNHIQVDPRTGEIIKADIRMGEGSGRHHLIPRRILESQLAMTWVILMNWLEAHKLPTHWKWNIWINLIGCFQFFHFCYMAAPFRLGLGMAERAGFDGTKYHPCTAYVAVGKSQADFGHTKPRDSHFVGRCLLLWTTKYMTEWASGIGNSLKVWSSVHHAIVLDLAQSSKTVKKLCHISIWAIFITKTYDISIHFAGLVLGYYCTIG